MSSDFFASEEPRGSAEPASAPDPDRRYGKRKRPRSWRSTIVAAVATVAMAGGAGAAVAAGSSGTPANAATVAASQVQSPAPTHPGYGGMGGHMPILHGQAVLSKPGGGYQTVAFQRGDVTAVSTGSITLKSTDGFTQTYTINGSTVVGAHRGGISSVKTGDTASVIATVSGKTFTAMKIIDWTLIPHNHMMLGLGHRGQG